uniref:Fc receptor-like protein 5 n=1 Tax=Semicossyphus pulcher TaxID=241346 RepID=UPI0037E85C79
MGQTSLCVLWLFLLNTLYGSAQGPTAQLTLQSNWTQIFWGETITFRCEIVGGGDTHWKYKWSTPHSGTAEMPNKYIISRATESDNGQYRCYGEGNPSNTQWSNPIDLTVTPYRPKAVLNVDRSSITEGETSTLTCSVNPPSSGWKYSWYRQEQTSEIPTTQDQLHGQTHVSQRGIYWCRGARENPAYHTDYSDSIIINRILSNTAVVNLQNQWTEIYSGENITFRCYINDGENTKWEYEWETTSSDTFPKHSESSTVSATVHSDGKYKCKGKRKTEQYSSTEWSVPITLSVSAKKPKAELSAGDRDIPVGGNVILTCSVKPPSGWTYKYYYRPDTSSNPVVTDDIPNSAGQIRVSQEGLYKCKGLRGHPYYFTKISDEILIRKNIANKAVVTLEPNWSEIYSEETITLRCDIKDGENTEWEYEWSTTSSVRPPKQKEYIIRSAYSSYSGDYRCKGRDQSEKSSTDWSDPITLTVSYKKPKPVLTVSPLWLSPGDTVTLNCEVEHPSAGWRFYWYKAIPNLSGTSYSYEQLPGSSNGTEKSSNTVRGQTHTAGYVCRAGRGDPVFYTDDSELKFVWSGDFHSSAYLTVTPNSVQQFLSDSVLINCEGNSTQWRVRWFPEDYNLVYCSQWGTMTGSTCTIRTYSTSNHVYWCESGSGKFSNAVNITKESSDIILVSPVHPVTEGMSVILSCKWKTYGVPDVFFYRNDKVIQNDTRRELNISKVSKSDEGFYKCQYSGKESSQSWMSVKAAVAVPRPEKSSFPVIPVTVALICGITLIFLLLLLYFYRRSKKSSFIRSVQSESTSQSSAVNNVGDQQGAHHDAYAPPLHGTVCLYESIKSPEGTANGAGQLQDVTYSLVELKNIRKKGKTHEQNESTVYSDVKMGAADDGIMYADVTCNNTGKGKKKKGKSSPAPTEESYYSEVKPYGS